MHFTAAAITLAVSLLALLVIAWRGLDKWIHPLSQRAANPGTPDPVSTPP